MSIFMLMLCFVWLDEFIALRMRCKKLLVCTIFNININSLIVVILNRLEKPQAFKILNKINGWYRVFFALLFLNNSTNFQLSFILKKIMESFWDVANTVYFSIFYNNLPYWLRFFNRRKSVILNSMMKPCWAIK